jgi:prevent-host-death family protein
MLSFMTMKHEHWSVAEAKASLSRVLSEAESGPQVIENRGRPVAVVISFRDYEKALGDPDAGSVESSRWRRFLAASARLRGRGGATIPLGKRTPRRSPFSDTGR